MCNVRVRIFCLISKVALFLLLISGSQAAIAGVNWKNGNFYISYTDLIVGYPEFEISRTYNSKSTKTLSFGFGWGTDFETSLTVAGDGSVVLNENGSGAQNFFWPARLDPAERAAIVEEMLIAMEAAGWLASDAHRYETRIKLGEDADLRRSMQSRLTAIGLMPERDLPIGERLTSVTDPDVFLVKEPGGYYRRGLTGHERFNLEGQLVELIGQNGEGFRIRRDAQGHLREIIASNGERIGVTANSSGHITQLETSKGTATYEYDDRNNLIKSTDIVGNVFRFEYDEKHNMRFIRYSDDSDLEIRYNDKSWVSFQRERGGQVTRYEYGNEPITEPNIIDQYFTRIRTYESEKDTHPRSDRTITYRIGRDSFGNTYTAGITQINDGSTTDTRYHPCGTPILIQRGSRRTEFDYDEKCRLTYKKTDREETRLEYNPRNSKISHVDVTNLSDGTLFATDFEYNLRGNLTLAEDSNGSRAELTYNADDQISEMRNESGQVLSFVYGPMGKPIRIAIEGVGTLDVEYDASGEIENVTSDQGHEMALQVTQAFQELLRLVKPSGVNLNL